MGGRIGFLSNQRSSSLTFIFPYVFESKRQAGIFPLDDSHFTKGSSADDSKKAEMIEVHCEAGPAKARVSVKVTTE